MFTVTISQERVEKIKQWFEELPWFDIVLLLSVFLSALAIGFSFLNGWLIAYGDAQSHLNIPKRVVDSLTPGMAQLGGIWLPLPHLLMVPFVKIELLYRTGLAGSIVSGIAFIVSCVYIYKFAKFLTKNYLASFIAFLVFALNPNILYLQTTAMSESVLICFFLLSSYYFIKFIAVALKTKQITEIDERTKDKEFLFLILAAFFGFCATLSRYDGWFLVLIEAAIVLFVYLPIRKYLHTFRQEKLKAPFVLLKAKLYLNKKTISKMQGMVILFIVLAFVGIGLWFLWDFLILGDPFYFTNSAFSAKSQQQSWLARGELPAYHDLLQAFLYYFFGAMTNVGVIIFGVFIVGLITYVSKNKNMFGFLLVLILFVPFFFNVLTLFMGQSVIFLPHITPIDFEWRLFNVRYGILMLPAAAIFYALLFQSAQYKGRLLLIFLILVQLGLYFIGYSKVMALADGIEGLSSTRRIDADYWIAENYDGGLVLMDDFARSINIIQSNIPMQNIIYIGNKPYWPESMKTPEKYATWIIVQENDDIWKNIYNKPDIRARLYKYFNKVYTSPETLIFKRMKDS